MSIDLRSDTVTLPTPAMLTATTHAKLGDDVYGEDPTVTQLEAEAAQRLGFEAALLLPTGTMANLCACLTHCRSRKRVVCGDQSHLFCYEGGGLALGGLMYHPIPNLRDGSLDLTLLDEALASHDAAEHDVHLA